MTWRDAAKTARRAAATADAWLGLVAFDAFRLGGFARLHYWVQRRPVAPRRVSSLDAEEIVWAVDEACVWYLKRVACLQRSVVAQWLLRRHGFPAELVIGCRALPFESHAWVEVNGRVIKDRPEYQKVFTVLDRL